MKYPTLVQNYIPGYENSYQGAKNVSSPVFEHEDFGEEFGLRGES
jgi:hypothetical protein